MTQGNAGSAALALTGVRGALMRLERAMGVPEAELARGRIRPLFLTKAEYLCNLGCGSHRYPRGEVGPIVGEGVGDSTTHKAE